MSLSSKLSLEQSHFGDDVMKKKKIFRYVEVQLPLQPKGGFPEKSKTFYYEGFSGNTSIEEAEKNAQIQYKSGRGRKKGSGAVSHSQIRAHVDSLVKHKKISLLKAFNDTAEKTGFDVDYIRNLYYRKQSSLLLEDPIEIDFMETHDYDTFKISLINQMQIDKGFYDAEILFAYTRDHYGYERAKEIMELFIKEVRKLLKKKPDWCHNTYKDFLNDSIKKAKQLVELKN